MRGSGGSAVTGSNKVCKVDYEAEVIRMGKYQSKLTKLINAFRDYLEGHSSESYADIIGELTTELWEVEDQMKRYIKLQEEGD